MDEIRPVADRGMKSPLFYRLSLAGILFLIALAAIILTSYTLYRQALNETREQLIVTAESQASLMNAIARFDRTHAGPAYPGGARTATLAQLEDAHSHYEAFGKTGEFVVAERRKDRIHFLLWHSRIHDNGKRPMLELPWDSDMAEPMRLALSGKAGVIVGHDYRGRQVLAAFEPVHELDLGIVVKLDVAEVQAPFIRATLISAGGVLLLFLLGTWLFGRITRPLLERIIRSEKLAGLLLNSAGEGIYGIDREGRCTFANAAACRMLGYSREEMLGCNLHALIHHTRFDGSRYPEAECPSSRMMQDGKPVHLEELFWHKNGTPIQVEYYIHPIEEGGEVTGAVVSFVDIRERKAAEAALRESEALFSATFNQAAVGIAHVAPDGRFIRVNDRLCEMLGYSPDEFCHARFQEITWPEDLERDVELLDELLRGDIDNYTIEKRYLDKQGEVVWALLTVTLVRDADGSPDFLISVIQDIRERKKAEEKLRESEARLAEAQKVAQIGNWELDLVNDKLAWSDEIYEIFEIDREKFGASYEAFLDAIHPEDREKVNRTYTDSVAHQRYYEISHRLLMSDGRVKYVQERGRSFYDGDGTPLRSIGTVQDITRMQEVEEQLRQAQKMEAVGTLVGGIAHDFNNKLAAITGNLYLAQRASEAEGEVAERLQAVEKLSFEAAAMVQQLLTFARKGKVERTPLTLVSFIKEAAKLNRVAIPENIHFSVDYGEDPLPVLGDVIQLQQVFLNLLTNARDALEGVDDARINVSMQRFVADKAFHARHPEAEKPDAWACLRVADNGAGIDPEHLDQVFDPFFTTKEAGKGTGLGLSMVYGVVRAHQGVIEVESRKGEGTTFSIYLPLHPEALDVLPDQAEEEAPHGEGELILIADDDTHVLSVFREVLESLGYRVIEAHDGLEAVERYREYADEVALVVLDIVMPRLKGPVAAEQIRAIRPDARILFATGYDSRRTLGSTGRDATVLEKPYRPAVVGRQIRDALRQA